MPRELTQEEKAQQIISRVSRAISQLENESGFRIEKAVAQAGLDVAAEVLACSERSPTFRVSMTPHLRNCLARYLQCLQHVLSTQQSSEP